MATINEMKDAVQELINSDGDVSIPGLEFDPVVDNLVEQKYKAQLDTATSEEERAEMKKSLIKYYSDQARDVIENAISQIKANFTATVEGLAYTAEAAAMTIASNSIPSVITTGAATSAPNLAYVLIENKQKKNTLLGMLKNIGNCLINLFLAAIEIAFSIPDSVMALVKTLTTVKNTVNAIPV